MVVVHHLGHHHPVIEEVILEWVLHHPLLDGRLVLLRLQGLGEARLVGCPLGSRP